MKHTIRHRKTWIAILALTVFNFVPRVQLNAQNIQIVRDTIKQEVVSYKDSREDIKQDIQFYFRLNSAIFDKDFSSNSEQIAALDKIMQNDDATIGLDSLLVKAAASIDGPKGRNSTLAKERSQSVKRFLSERYSKINPQQIQTRFVAEEWDKLREIVVQDENIPYKEEVLKIIDDPKRGDDNREWALKILRGGEPWEYLKKNILPKMRYGASLIFYYQMEKMKVVTEVDVVKIDTIITPIPPAPKQVEKRPIAIKTNLLYDALLTANIELEIPIGRRFSIGAEYIFPWWSSNKDNYTQRMQIGHLSATYWLGNREELDYLNGWNVGVFGGYGDYDIQLLRTNGEQGTVFNSGLSIGYAHRIANNLNLHYQIGLGYAQFSYREYHKMWDTRYGDVKVFDYPWETKRRNWFGPTQAEVSLVWMLNFKRTK